MIVIGIFKARDIIQDLSTFSGKVVLHGLELILLGVIILLELTYMLNGQKTRANIYTSSKPMMLNVSTLHELFWTQQMLGLYQEQSDNIFNSNTYLRVLTSFQPAPGFTSETSDQVSTAETEKSRRRSLFYKS